MNKKKLFLDHLVLTIGSLSTSEKLLSQSALDFQAMGLAKKHQIEAAIDRAAELGKVLNRFINLLERVVNATVRIGD